MLCSEFKAAPLWCDSKLINLLKPQLMFPPEKWNPESLGGKQSMLLIAVGALCIALVMP